MVRSAAVRESVPPASGEIVLLDRAVAWASWTAPCRMTVGPLTPLAPDSESMPAPRFTIVPDPLTAPEKT